jgi:Ca2+-binding RTX toxin-like protein
MPISTRPFGVYDVSGTNNTLNLRWSQIWGRGSDDAIVLNKKNIGGWGYINLGSGNDSVRLAEAGSYTLQLVGTETIRADQAATNLRFRSDVTTSTDGSFEAITAGYGVQHVTFTGALRANTIELGDLIDKVTFANTSTAWAYVKTATGVDVYDLTSGLKVDAHNNTDIINVDGVDVAFTGLATGTMGGLGNITLSAAPSFNSNSVTFTSSARGVAHVSSGTSPITNSAESASLTRNGSSSLTLAAQSPNPIEGSLRIYVGSANSGLYVDFTQIYLGTNGNDTRAANNTATAVYGFGGNDNLNGGTANDTIYGGEGNDVIDSGGGADFVDGGAGNDQLTGGDGVDTLIGGDGDDTITGGAGADSINAGAGNDTLQFANGAELAADSPVNGGDGTDTISFTSPATDIDDADFAQVSNIEAVRLADGNNTVVLGTNAAAATPGSSVLTITGGTGNDNINISALGEAASVVGGDGNDSLTGSALADTLVGGDGDDTIIGGAGNDSIDSGNGNDTLRYANGAELAADATVIGGAGNDTIEFTGAATDIDDADFARVTQIEAISLTSGPNTVVLGANAEAATTNLTITGGTGADTIDVSGMTNGVSIVAGDGNDLITGSLGNDNLSGGAFNDTILGGDGNDVISGGSGTDMLTGGAGLDTFVFSAATDSPGSAIDTITDYAIGVDTVDFWGNAVITASAGADTPVAGSNVNVSAQGLVTFDAADDTLAERVAALQADTQLNAAANSVAIFTVGADSYLFYSGAAGTADSQFVRLEGMGALDSLTVDGSGNLAVSRAPTFDWPITVSRSFVPVPSTTGAPDASNPSASSGIVLTSSVANSIIDPTPGVAGFGTVRGSGDDYSVAVPITDAFGSGVNFFNAPGVANYTTAYMGSNGYITFARGYNGYVPSGVAGFTFAPMIAGQFDDLFITSAARNVSAGNGGEGLSTGSGSMYSFVDATRAIFTWDNVRLYSSNQGGYSSNNTTDRVGSAFQIILTEIGDGTGNFSIEILYEDLNIQYNSANAGWTAGDAFNYGLVGDGIGGFELEQAVGTSNVGVNGVWAWNVEGGRISPAATAGYYLPDVDPATGLDLSTSQVVAEITVQEGGPLGNDFTPSYTTNSADDDFGRFIITSKAGFGNVFEVKNAANAKWNIWKENYKDLTTQISVGASKVGGGGAYSAVTAEFSVYDSGSDTVVRGDSDGSDDGDRIDHLASSSKLTVYATSTDLNNAQDSEISTITLVNIATTSGANVSLANQGVASATEGFTINGNSGNDTITGGGANDTITGGAGVDSLVGGTGNDLFILASATDDGTGETYSGGNGSADTLRITGTSTVNLSNDTVNTIEILDLTTDTGAQTIVISAAQATGISTINGGSNDIIRLSDTTVTLADLKALEARTISLIDATSVTSTSGTAADAVLMLVTNEGTTGDKIDMKSDVAVTVNSGTATVTQANDIDGQTTGVVTATISDTLIATLAGLTGTGNAYTATVTDASVDAAALNTLDGKTTVNVGATGVTLLTGTAATIATAISAATIDTAANVGATVSNGAVLASDLNTIDANTTATVDASAVVTSITGSASEFATLVTTNASTTTLAANYAATITGTVSGAQADVVNADTTGLVSIAGTSGADTVDLTGATGAVAILGEGGNDNITAGGGADTITGGAGADLIDGGAGTDSYVYSLASDSTVNNAVAPATGFDIVALTNGDIFDFGVDLNAVVATPVVAAGGGAEDPADGNGDSLIAALDALFALHEDGLTNREAMVIQFDNGDQYIVADVNGDRLINNADTIIKITGVVTGLTLTGGGDAVVAI